MAMPITIPSRIRPMGGVWGRTRHDSASETPRSRCTFVAQATSTAADSFAGRERRWPQLVIGLGASFNAAPEIPGRAAC